uniref:Uncharacterized protein n=1 Tax=Sphaerodactylus townsendi TaxID=933632 RepID=A0ACB8GCZ6_9SAUR
MGLSGCVAGRETSPPLGIAPALSGLTRQWWQDPPSGEEPFQSHSRPPALCPPAQPGWPLPNRKISPLPFGAARQRQHDPQQGKGLFPGCMAGPGVDEKASAGSATVLCSSQIWDFPGQIDFFDPTFDYEMIFRGTGALIFVIDSQDDYMEALARLHLTVTRAYKVNPDINFEIFIHKVDGLSDDHKIETQRDIHQRTNDDLADAGLEKIHLSFYLTSIYDHSIFEAFSKVVQKLIPQLPTLENLLNIFISNSGIEKAFLFDVVSKIYIATDSSPVDMQTYELSCDMIDVVIDISCIYGLKDGGAGTPYDKESTAIIKLNNTTVLYLKEVTKFLALVCFVREESFERKGLIDYNFHCFRKAIHEVFEVRMKVVKARKNQNQMQKAKRATPNGTPRMPL